MTDDIRRLWARTAMTGARYVDVRRQTRHAEAAARWRLLAAVDAWMQDLYPGRGARVEEEP